MCYVHITNGFFDNKWPWISFSYLKFSFNMNKPDGNVLNMLAQSCIIIKYDEEVVQNSVLKNVNKTVLPLAVMVLVTWKIAMVLV